MIRLRAILGVTAAVVTLAGCAHLVVLHDPLSASEHNDLGVAYEANGQAELASREYRASLRLDSHQGRARVNLGNVDASEGRWRAAEKAYRRALRDSSEDTDAMNNLAVALLRQGRHHEEARALAVRAVTAGAAGDSCYRATLDEANHAAVKAASPGSQELKP